MTTKIHFCLISYVVFFHVLFLLSSEPVAAQYEVYETNKVQVFYRTWHSHLAPHVAKSFENALEFHMDLFDWRPWERPILLIDDWVHYGNAWATPIPRNTVGLSLSPTARAMETLPERERISSALNHEVAHLVTGDKPSASDRFFRNVFGGKVSLSGDDPITLFYGQLTTPRWASPRWYKEGIAVYLETWMGGGYGRALGPYDEMVFRAKVLDEERLFDFVGLESEGTSIGVDAGASSYLYGTRFVSYLAYAYGNDKLVRWYDRSDGTKRTFLGQFKRVYEKSLDDVWSEWLAWEADWQTENLTRIRKQPLSPYRIITDRALGRVSRAHVSGDYTTLFVAMSLPGQVAQLAAIDLNTGKIQRVTEIVGASGMNVTSLAYDDSSATLFYTSNNGEWPHLKSFNIESGQKRMLIEFARVGDLAFNPADKSLWGVRHSGGVSTIVRIPSPYREWEVVHVMPLGDDIYDLDISPDGSMVVGSLIEITGKQFLAHINIDDLDRPEVQIEKFFEFGNWEPQNFTFSGDGKFLFGSSYYSGVSNIYRFDFENEIMEPLSNVETGLFRPVPIGTDSVVAFRYSGKGFVPVMIPNEVPTYVSAVSLLGNEIKRTRTDVQNWDRSSLIGVVNDSVETSAQRYVALSRIGLDSVYPILRGYEDEFGTNAIAVGLRANFSDNIGRIRIDATSSYSPSSELQAAERFHGSLDFRYRRWTINTSLNRTDFYDLFGPTKNSRKGFNASVGYKRNLLYDEPKRVDYSVEIEGWTGLASVPEFQNIGTSFTKLLATSGDLTYEFRRKSMGAVEEELGVAGRIAVRSNLVDRKVFPRAFGEFAYGILLPIDHSSIWLRVAAGTSLRRDRDQPFARFYFGGFRNNWIDHGSVKRYRDYSAFPGADINSISGTNFGKIQAEWVLPPLRFRRIGFPEVYLRWASLSLFGGGLITELDPKLSDLRRRLVNLGGQLDFRLVTLSRMDSTISFGYALVFEDGRKRSDEWMISLKIL